MSHNPKRSGYSPFPSAQSLWQIVATEGRWCKISLWDLPPTITTFPVIQFWELHGGYNSFMELRARFFTPNLVIFTEEIKQCLSVLFTYFVLETPWSISPQQRSSQFSLSFPRCVYHRNSAFIVSDSKTPGFRNSHWNEGGEDSQRVSGWTAHDAPLSLYVSGFLLVHNYQGVFISFTVEHSWILLLVNQLRKC